MDNLVFEESISSEISQSEFISKKWLYVNDINNGNYASQIIVDSTPLANSGGYVNWSEGYIAMPLIVSLSGVANCGTDANADLCAHSWAFKSGFWHMISSMSVEFNNQTIVQQTPFLNVFRSFKALTSFSLDDLAEGYTIGFSPDTASSWAFENSTTADPRRNGVGLSNNRNAPLMSGIVKGSTAENSTVYIQNGVISAFGDTTANLGTLNPSNTGGSDAYNNYNRGFATRSNWYGYTPISDTEVKGQDIIMGPTPCGALARAYRLPSTSTTVASWSVMAKLRLKDLAEYFEKCPLLKGSTMRFLINTNQTTVNFTTTAPTATAATGVVVGGSVVLNSVTSQGQTCPLMIASSDVGQGASTLLAGTYNLSVSIFRDTTNNVNSPSSVPVRLYAPVYKMNPIAEQRYLSLAPTKRIEYCDIFSYQFTGIGKGASFNFLVSNGIPNIKSVLVVPFIDAGTYSTVQATNITSGTGQPTILSPFSTSGATPDPIPLTNFNIQISGVNLFLNNQLYDYEQFNQELKSSNQLNGSLTTGLSSGLISENDFSRGMRYYYGNASRILPSEEGVSRSVQVLGTNSSGVQISLMVFVEFKKSMTVDISTGARID